mgnify:CR=1 FL=1
MAEVFLLNIKLFLVSLQTFIMNPIVLITYILTSFMFMFLHIANVLLRKKNDKNYSVDLFQDIPKVFFLSLFVSLLFVAACSFICFFRDASQASYADLNKYLNSKFSITTPVSGSLLKDYKFIKLETKESKDDFQKALNLVYADQEISFADLDYLAKKTKSLSLNEEKDRKRKAH